MVLVTSGWESRQANGLGVGEGSTNSLAKESTYELVAQSYNKISNYIQAQFPRKKEHIFLCDSLGN